MRVALGADIPEEVTCGHIPVLLVFKLVQTSCSAAQLQTLALLTFQLLNLEKLEFKYQIRLKNANGYN